MLEFRKESPKGVSACGICLVNMQDCDIAEIWAGNLHWAYMQLMFEHFVKLMLWDNMYWVIHLHEPL